MNPLPPASADFVSAEKISEICSHTQFGSFLKLTKKVPGAQVNQAVEPSAAQPQSLCFISTEIHLEQALRGGASILIALEKLSIPDDALSENQALFRTPSIPAAMALILPFFDQKSRRFPEGIHPSASIASTASIGQSVRIGPFAVIGDHAIIEDGAWIGAHTVVETGAYVGTQSILHPHVFIGARCRIGKFCELHPHVTIGSDGFGYVQSPDLRRHKIPQIGVVVLEDFVEMGGNCVVDRATLGETRIGEGTKFDNLCHVAHNCKIGRHNVFAGGLFVAGSTEIGDNCMTGGTVVIADHVKVGNGITLGGRSAVTKDVLEPGAYTGYPLEPLKDGLKTIANLAQLTQMRKHIAQIRKHLGLKDD
jgi:UDP-3-O-[3-hydroxymyristoyl] glucosamine N-acyltransferase